MKLKDKMVIAPEDAAKSDARQQIITFAENIRSKLTGGASPCEVAGWPNKAERARRLLEGKASEADRVALQIEVQARGRGETAEALAKHQLTKEAQYAKAAAFIDGLKAKGLKAIEQAQDYQLEDILKKLSLEANKALKEMEGD